MLVHALSRIDSVTEVAMHPQIRAALISGSGTTTYKLSLI